MNRRDFIKAGSALGALGAMAGCRCPLCGASREQMPIPYAPNLRDRCWMWGHDTGVYDGPDGKGGLKYNIPGSEPITMADACCRMGIPHVCVIRWNPPTQEYLSQFKKMKRISWVMGGDARIDMYKTWHDQDIRLFHELPNMVGFDLDDFFLGKHSYLQDGQMVCKGILTLNQLRALRAEVRGLSRPADLRLVLYSHQLAPEIVPVLRNVDTILFWTWSGADLSKLEANFATLRGLVPEKPVMLGIYMWDFGGKKPLAMDFMKGQLKVAHDLFRRGEVEGFVFHCTPLVNKNLEAVEYARCWIDEHAEETCA